MGLAIARLNHQLQRTVQSTKALVVGAGVAGAGIGVAIERWSHDDLQRRTQDFQQEKSAADAWVASANADFASDIDSARRTKRDIQGRIEDYAAKNPPPNGANFRYTAGFDSYTELYEPDRMGMWLVVGTVSTIGAFIGGAAAAMASTSRGVKAGVAGAALAGALLAGATVSNLTH